MRNLRSFAVFLVLMLLPVLLISQADSASTKKQKKRFNFSGLPVVAYDADMGFQYGLVVNMYDYGDWSTYPEYRHAVKIEISRFTKGSGVNQIFYDSKYLIPGNIRLTADVSYLTEKALDFYGYNGYQAVYQPTWEDDEDSAYITRMFYRHERKMFRFTCDFQGHITGENFRWLAGLGIFWVAFHRMGRWPSPGAVGAALLLLACATLVLYSLWILVISAAFYLVKIDNLSYLFSSIYDAARWPADVFRGFFRVLFTFVVPLALLTTYPALALLGKLEPRVAGLVLAGALAFAAASRLIWTRALAKYTSASS